MTKKHSKKHSEQSENMDTKLFKYLDDTGIIEKAILRNFVDWFAIPKGLRRPKTMSEFATQFGVSIDTLTNWKKIPKFYEEVDLIFSRDILKHAPDVVYLGWVKPAKGGNPKAADSYMAYYKGFKTRQSITYEPPTVDQKTAEKLAIAFKNNGYTPTQTSIVIVNVKEEVENSVN